MLTIDTAMLGNRPLLRLAGQLDSAAEEPCRHALTAAVRDGRAGLFLHLEGIDFISPTGLRVLLLAVRHAQNRRIPVVLFNPSQALHDTLGQIGLLDEVAVRSLDEAHGTPQGMAVT